MADPKNTPQSGAERSSRKKRWLRYSLFLLLLLVAAALSVPLACRYGLQHWLLANGADRAEIGAVRINPFTAAISLRDITIVRKGKTVLSESRIDLNLGLSRVIRKQAFIQSIEFHKISLDISQDADGRMRIASVLVPEGSDSSQESTDDTGTPWIFRADRVSFSDCTIHFKRPDLELTLAIDKARLVRFTTEPGDKSGAFTFKGRINGAPLSLQLDTLRVLPDVVLKGKITTSDLQCAWLDKMLRPWLTPFTGSLGLDGRIEYGSFSSGIMEVGYRGTIALAGGDIGGSSWKTAGKTLTWDGNVSYRDTPEQAIVIDTDGSLHGTDLRLDLPNPKLLLQEPDLELAGKTRVTLADTVRVESDATLTGRTTRFSLPPYRLDDTGFQWQGTVFYISAGQDGGQQVKADGGLSWQNPKFVSSDETTAIQAGGSTATWKGSFAYNGSGDGKKGDTVTLQGALRLQELALALPDQLDIQEQDLRLNGTTALTLADKPTFNYDGTILLQDTQLETGDLMASGVRINWQGKAGYSGAKTGERITLDGALTAEELAARQTNGMRMDQESLQLAGRGTVLMGENLSLQGTASLQSENFHFFATSEDKNPLLSLDRFSVADLEAPGGREIKVPLVRADNLTLIVAGSLPMQVTIPEIRLQEIRTSDLATVHAGLLRVQSPSVLAMKNQRQLARLGSLELKKLVATTEGEVAVDRLNFDDFFFLDRQQAKQDPVCRINGATLSGISWSPDQGLNSHSLGFDDLFCTLIRQKDGNLDLNNMLAAMRTSTAPAPESKPEPQQAAEKDSKEKKPAANLRIQSVIVRGESGLHFEDHTLAVPFISDLAIETLQITDIDSADPEQPAHIRMTGTLENRAPLEIQGKIAPFAPDLSLNLKIKLKNYPLARLSAYTVQSVGTALAAGRLKLKTRLAIADKRMDMDNKLVFKKLQTRTISKELAKELDNQLPVPLDTALSMLRDSKGNITLDIPIKGPLADLNVGIADILVTALGKAIIPAASSYLVYTLGPYAALAYVGMKVGEKMLQVSLPPVEFAPGSAELDEQQKKYLERVATLLKERPETDLQLMPMVNVRELHPEAQEEKKDMQPPKPGSREKKKLLQLGQERAKAIKNYLVQTWSIDHDRLMISMTRITTKKKEKSRVEIQM